MTSSEPTPPPAGEDTHITWDEAAIQQHESEAGVLYGTQKVEEAGFVHSFGPCEEAVTPFLYNSDGVKTPGAAEGNGGVNNGNKAAPKDGAGATAAEEEERHRREEVDASELRERLGVCLDAMRDPPPPWLKMKSRSEDPGAVFYFNPATNQTRWDFPEEDEGGGGAAGGVDDDDDEEEDEPIVVSRLTRAQDSAAQFLSKQR